MGDDVRVTPSCGNVFKDMGLPDADELFLKAKLGMLKVFSSLKERQTSLEEAASLFKVEASEIEPLFNGEFSDYSAERLFRFLNSLDYSVDVYISPSKGGQTHQQIHATD